MLILEIALGIVLGFAILKYLAEILALSLALIFLSIGLVLIVAIGWAIYSIWELPAAILALLILHSIWAEATRQLSTKTNLTLDESGSIIIVSVSALFLVYVRPILAMVIVLLFAVAFFVSFTYRKQTKTKHSNNNLREDNLSSPETQPDQNHDSINS